MSDDRREKSLRDYLQFNPPPSVEQTPTSFTFSREHVLDLDWEKLLEEAGGFKLPAENAHLVRFLRRHFRGKDFGLILSTYMAANLSEDAPAFVHDPKTIGITPFTAPEIAAKAAGTKEAGTPIVNSGARRVPTAGSAIKIESGGIIMVPTIPIYELLAYTDVELEKETEEENKAIDALGEDLVRRRLRTYLLLDHAGRPLVVPEKDEEEDGQNVDAAAKAAAAEARTKRWEEIFDQLGAIQLVYADGEETSEEAAKKNFTFTEIARADASIIKSKYDALRIERDLAAKHKERAAALAASIPSADPAVVEQISAEYRRLMAYARTVETSISQLSDAASALGYYLVTKPGETRPIINADGSAGKLPLQEGELYTTRPRTVAWTTEHKKRSGRDTWGRRKHKYYTERHTATFDFFEPAKVDNDPWVEILDFYTKQGFDTYRFRVGADGELTSDTISLKELVDAIDTDEERRLRTVVALPITEQSILGDEFLSGYLIIGRPLPELRRLEFPRIVLRQEMSYRFAWTGTALGELVTTIPLSPGEERDVDIVVSTVDEERHTQTSSSLVDISRVDKQDFESVFEKEVRKETEKKETLTAEAKGSYGAASGSAKFEQQKTSRDIARTLNRAVQKTSQTLSRREKYETKTEHSASRSTTQTNTISYKVRNINDAVTLNVCLYRLLNEYESMLRVEDFSLSIETGRSLLAGAEIYHRERFELHSIEALVEHLISDEDFPVDLSQISEAQKGALGNAIAQAIAQQNAAAGGATFLSCCADGDHKDPELDKLFKAVPALAPSGAGERLSATGALEVIGSELQALEKGAGASNSAEQDDAVKTLRNAQQEVTRLHSATVKQVEVRDALSRFTLDSGGLYADVVLGSTIGADQYSQDRRALELRRVEADIELTLARRKWLEARAANLGSGGAAGPQANGGRTR